MLDLLATHKDSFGYGLYKLRGWLTEVGKKLDYDLRAVLSWLTSGPVLRYHVAAEFDEFVKQDGYRCVKFRTAIAPHQLKKSGR